MALTQWPGSDEEETDIIGVKAGDPGYGVEKHMVKLLPVITFKAYHIPGALKEGTGENRMLVDVISHPWYI